MLHLKMLISCITGYVWLKQKLPIANMQVFMKIFPDDPLLGKANGVDSTTAALKTEGVDVENIKNKPL